MLARASTREKEMGMRMAVGERAAGARLIRQLFTRKSLLARDGCSAGRFVFAQPQPDSRSLFEHANDPLFVDLGTEPCVFLGSQPLSPVPPVFCSGSRPALPRPSGGPGFVLKGSAENNRGRIALNLAAQFWVVSHQMA